MNFSQRIGKRPIKTILQVESIDDDLKNRLWNIILEVLFKNLPEYSPYQYTPVTKEYVCELIWKEFYKLAIDEIPSYTNSIKTAPAGVISYIRKWFFSAYWYEIYDLIEFLAMIDTEIKNVGFVEQCNLALKKEVAGYRIIDGKILQITTEEEVREIEEAQLTTSKWKSVDSHLQSALEMLADRKNPDYRNSIKESISAVEALCKIICEDEKATLGKALGEIEKNRIIHGALKSAFSSLYGYTSDTGGIRHALLEDNKEVRLEDAKFMLVSCSAFINYLQTKTQII